MFMFLKKSTSLILAILLFTSIGATVLASTDVTVESTSDIPEVSSAEVNNIKKTILEMFETYYECCEDKSVDYEKATSDLSSYFTNNKNTYLHLCFFKSDKAFIDAFNLNYQNCIVTLNYDSINVASNKAIVNLTFDLDYNYARYADIDSSINNVKYIIQLEKINNEWLITSIETDLIDVSLFVESLQLYVTANHSNYKSIANYTTSDYLEAEALTSTEKLALDDFTSYKISDINTMKKQVSQTARSNNVTNELENNSSDEESQSRATFSYTPSTGASYAISYAEKDTSSRLFYTNTSGTGDCTNFVSQCVWAGYGAYNSSNLTQTRNNIQNRVRMVYTGSYNSGWYAGTGGGCANWETVSYFYNYVTGSSTYGPKATGKNNGKVWSNYPTISDMGMEADIIIGDVLQLRNGSSGNYAHSIYVSARAQGPIYPANLGLDLKLYCSHSSDTTNRAILQLIYSFGGSNCYLRGLRFRSASFSS